MIPLFSTQQVREADSHAIKKLGIPGILLMENASREIYSIALEYFPEDVKGHIGFVCGKGNNGGDGFAAARHFANHGFIVTVVFIGSPAEMSEDCRLNFDILKNISSVNKNIFLIPFKSTASLAALKKCPVVFDALLGSGASGELKKPYAEIVGYLNKLNSFKIAIDIPSGLNADSGYSFNKLKVDLTITLGELKKGLFIGEGYELCGEVRKGEIGIGPEFFSSLEVKEYLAEPEDAYNFLPGKERGINKYSAGKVLTIAGSGKYPGAAVMTSKAALKSGAGASVLAFPKSARELIHKEITEIVVEPYEDEGKEYLSVKNVDDLSERISWADAVAIGPGLGRSKETQSAVLEIIKKRKFKNLVIDADGLFPLNKKFRDYNLKNIVLTPHLGEFSSLTGIPVPELKKDLLKYGREFTKDTGAILILKGAPTMIFTGSEVFVNTTGNPGMAKFGTGDVLTGILAGFIAQQDDLIKSLICGVYIHSLTADLLKNIYTEYGYSAENIIEHFPMGIKFLKDTFAAEY
jgi:ADP-dependent NAD(P)H-hydrate dehydratase / NAD(P)H-hydrate epimerase